jgi:hypothetical protein
MLLLVINAFCQECFGARGLGRFQVLERIVLLIGLIRAYRSLKIGAGLLLAASS